MKILSIETSCDETAISILEAECLSADRRSDFNDAKFEILADNLISQIDIHKEYGGAFPALAKREHSKNLIPILQKTLSDAKLNNQRSESSIIKNNINKILEREPELLKLFIEYIPTIEIPEIDAIAVTQGPGLEPALWVGINFAKALSLVWDKPLIPVNHMEGHLLASLINPQTEKIQFPAIGLLISGGHTELILMKAFCDYEKIGQTRDDAVGEAFDKVARMMGLPYPGGPEISKLAQTAREKISRGATPIDVGVAPLRSQIKLPRPMLHTDDFDFSFSGLKTAVLYLIKNLKKVASSATHRGGGKEESELSLETKQQIALEFETAVIEVLLKKTEKALEKYGAQTLIIGGGVSANSQIRQSLRSLENRVSKLKVLIPEKEFSTDNAVMIGVAGYFRYLTCPPMRREQKEKGQPLNAIDLDELRADGNLRF